MKTPLRNGGTLDNAVTSPQLVRRREAASTGVGWAPKEWTIRSLGRGPGVASAALAHGSRHRGVKVPDLLIAAAATWHGLTVIHYDADFDLIAAVTAQPARDQRRG